MKNARDITIDSSDEAFLQEFDLREIDASPPSFWTRKWWARNRYLVSIVTSRVPSGGRILDVGCASGNLAITLAELGYRCVASDLRPGFLEYGRKKDDQHLVSWVAANGHQPPFRDHLFDVVILGEIIEHVAEPADLIVRGMRLVSPGGFLLCTTPNGAAFRIRSLPSYATASQDLDDLRARQFGPAGADHLFAIRPEEMLALAPEGTSVETLFVVSALWNRVTGVVARFKLPSEGIEQLSRLRVWRRYLCENLIALYRSDESASGFSMK